MATTFATLIITAMVITTVVNFAKPSYEKLVAKKYEATISIGIAFILGLIAAFSIEYGLELTIGAKILLGLGLGTGATIWYDAWKVVQEFTSKSE